LHNGTINEIETLIMTKSGGKLTLGGANAIPAISVNLSLNSGTLNDGGKDILVNAATATAITNNGIHESTIATGKITLTGPTAILGSGTFGNLTISTAGTVTTSGDHTVTNDLRLTAATILNIQSNALTVLGGIYDAATGTATAGFATNKRIQTLGLRNDGGLTRQGTSAAAGVLFPVGAATYTPSTIITQGATTYGRITVRPVSSAHPDLPTASVGQSLSYYWRVTSTGFVMGSGSVTHTNYNYATATLVGTLTNYKVARYDPVSFTWSSAFPHTASGSIIKPSPAPAFQFNFGTNIDGNTPPGT
jgi:hypothetical protein